MSATHLIPNPPDPAVKLATLYSRQTIRISVLTAGCGVRLAHDRMTLDMPPPLGGVGAGLLITDVDRQVQEDWFGDLWMLGDPANAVRPTVEVDTGDAPLNP